MGEPSHRSALAVPGDRRLRAVVAARPAADPERPLVPAAAAQPADRPGQPAGSTVEIKPFQLTKRQVLIDRLVYDPQVVAAANDYRPRQQHAARGGDDRSPSLRPRDRRRPSTPTIYFRVGYSIARAVARFLYRVRLGFADERTLAGVPPNTAVVFVMNHRSNMDYVLVAFLAAERTALSYAVGEWARIWPLQQLIRSMGAYFVRRNSNNPIYRRVLERYVHMATEAGVAQAMYPEGGLSRDGRLREPKLGLFDYMLKSFDPKGTERHRLRAGGAELRPRARRIARCCARSTARRRGAAPGSRPARALAFWFGQLGLMLRGRWFRFGYACVNFGGLISARDWLAEPCRRASAATCAASTRSSGSRSSAAWRAT